VARPDLVPSFCVVFASAVWGLFWIPMRALAEVGLDGGWPSLGLYLSCFLLCLPIMAWRRQSLLAGGLGLLVTGLFTGAAFSLYVTSLLLSEVVRVLLLFYMTPIWSTLLGRLLLGERITWNRLLAIVCGIAGLYVILGADGGLPLPRNLGDWLALAAGWAWAYGSLRVHRDPGIGVVQQSTAFFAGGLVISLLVLLLPELNRGALPAVEAMAGVAPWFLVMAWLFVLPATILIFWGARLLSPGRLGILLMGELLVGVASAAVLAGEPFGAREILGTVLIAGAGVIEVARAPVVTTPS
jgi:drug/metabolite transporter (DMT)-like permease